MKLSELQSKKIITTDGIYIGNIVDIIIDNGTIKSIITDKKKSLFNPFSNSEIEINWNNIKTIGPDIIIVECKLNC